MIVRSIDRPDWFAIVDESEQKKYYGCDQEWYGDEWQRRAGCGPSVATNLYAYLVGFGKGSNSKKSWLSLMEEVWAYVTPSKGGMPDTKTFYESVLSYAGAKGQHFVRRCCDLPENKPDRPAFSVVLKFIEEGLQKDAPVAFLNLCNGEETNLYKWHWVTVISLEYEEGGSAFVDILDEGRIKRINLALWYETTTLGGGFVYFDRISLSA